MCIGNLNYDLEHARKVAKAHGADLVIVTEHYSTFKGYNCTCGYRLEEGDYSLKGRTDDYICYVCEKCGYLVVVYLHKLPEESELRNLVKYNGN